MIEGVQPNDSSRRDGDFYATPVDVVREFLARWAPCIEAPASILEPSAGAGAFLVPLRETWPEATVDAYDIAPKHDAVKRRDVWSGDLERTYELIITNPPYSCAREFIDAHWPLVAPGGHLVLLLRLAFLESVERRAWWRTRRPERVYVLSHRPTFRNGQSEPRTAYAWFVWRPGRRLSWSRLEVL